MRRRKRAEVAALMHHRRRVCRVVDGQRRRRQSPVDGSESPCALQRWAKGNHAQCQTPEKMKVGTGEWMWLG